MYTNLLGDWNEITFVKQEGRADFMTILSMGLKSGFLLDSIEYLTMPFRLARLERQIAKSKSKRNK
jgi:uncharacterized membrane protein YciS (DUF1049 family)